MTRAKILLFVTISASMLLGQCGCSNTAAQQQEMFAKGQYEQIIKKWPDTEIARRARAKIADDLFLTKKYDEIFKNYADTPAAYKARNAEAETLFAEGRYQELVDKYPGSSQVGPAKNMLADSLIAKGLYDSVFKKFADLPKVTALKDSLAKVEFDKIKTTRGSARETALQNFMMKWPGTAAYKEAARLQQEAKTKK